MHSSVLRYIVEVAKHGSIRKAGAALNVSSSGINQRILALEHELGVALFVRSPQGMVPTSAGRLLLKHAHSTLREYDNLLPLINDVRNLKAGHVRFASEPGVYESLIPEIHAKFTTAHPQGTVSAFQVEPGDVIKCIAEGQVEIGITYTLFERQSVRLAHEYPTPLGALVSSDHPLATAKSTELAECLEFPLVQRDQPGSPDRLLENVLEREGRRATLGCITNSLALTKRVVRSGRAVAVGPAYSYVDDLDSGEMVFVPISHADLSVIRLGIFVPGNRHLDTIERRWVAIAAAVIDTQLGRLRARYQVPL